MRILMTCLFASALMLPMHGGAWAANSGGLTKRIKAAGPASADGARTAISLLHAALLQPASQVTSEARGICGRYLPTALEGMRRGHVATCALQADAYEALAACAWLSGDKASAKASLAQKLSLLDCPSEGVDGVRRATRIAAGWLWPEVMEPIVFKQRSSLKNREDATARSRRAVDLNIKELTEARRRRKAIQAALGSKPAAGLLVLGTAAGTSSAKAGIRPDDVIVLAGATTVRGLRELRALSLKTPSTPVTVYRRGAAVQLVLRGGLEGLEALEVPSAR